MEKRRTYFTVICLSLQAITSYLTKFHPYKVAWATIWFVGGIIQSVCKRGIAPFVISFAIMLIPYAIKGIIRKLDEMDARWRIEHRLEKERKREFFKKYVEEYIQMKIKN